MSPILNTEVAELSLIQTSDNYRDNLGITASNIYDRKTEKKYGKKSKRNNPKTIEFVYRLS